MRAVAETPLRRPLPPAWPWALRALRRELIEFRFDYPVEAVPEARVSRALAYHVRSDRLFLDDLVFDREGVPMKRYRTVGLQYNPLFVAWWGLVNLDRHLRGAGASCRETFLRQVFWLAAHAVRREDGAVVWPCGFDWREGRCRLQAPWISAMYQGVVMSALIRAHRLIGRGGLLPLCEGAARVFERPIEAGGVRSVEHGQTLYEEYPAYPLARVLDGFLFSLLGLYDLQEETGEPRHRRLFDEGLAGLAATLRLWDYRGKWSWYGTHGYLCPPHYHKLNGVLLARLGELAGEPALSAWARRWDPPARSARDRLEIYLAFVLTKNWARLRLPRN